MANENKKFVAQFFGLSLLFSALIVGINVLVDPYDVLAYRSPLKRAHSLFDDERVTKYFHMATYKPEIILIGGSRIRELDARELEKVYGTRVYNYGFSKARIEEVDEIVRYAVDHRNIKKVIIGINFYSFAKRLEGKDKQKPWPKDLYDNPGLLTELKYRVKYIFSKDALIKSISNTFTRQPLPHQSDGSVSIPRLDYLMSQSTWEQRAEEILGGFTKVFSTSWEYSEPTFERFAGMLKWLDQRGVPYEVFIPPIHQSLLDLMKANPVVWEDFLNWKVKLAKITSFHDFATYNDITRNKEYFYDPSHFKTHYSHIVFDALRKEGNPVVKNFGTFVPRYDAVLEAKLSPEAK